MLKQLLKELVPLFVSKIAEMQHPVSADRNGYIHALRCIKARELSTENTVHLES